MRFALDDKIKIKSTGEIGQIQMCKYEVSINHRDKVETNKYLVKSATGHIHTWYFESEIEYPYEFDDKFELGIIDLQMNVNLSLKNYDMCQHLHNQKLKYKKEGK